MKAAVILPAAGLGTRMGRSVPERAGTSRKQFMLLDGAPILLHTIRKFLSCDSVSEIVLALRKDDLAWVEGLLKEERPARPVRMVEGGDTRQQSVENALAAIGAGVELVAVHDAVRPFIEPSTIERVIREAAESGAAIVGIVPVDTVKQVDKGTVVGKTLDRAKLWTVQTPQTFRVELIRQAYAKLAETKAVVTDDAAALELIGEPVRLVEWGPLNLKVTVAEDLTTAATLLRI